MGKAADREFTTIDDVIVLPVSRRYSDGFVPYGWEARAEVLVAWASGIAMKETESRAFLPFLVAEIFGEKIGHEVQGFGGFGELEVVPEGVGQGFEDDELGVVVGAD